MEHYNQERKPVIGISGDIIVVSGAERHAVRDSYVSAILNAGGAPLIIPALGDEAAARAVYSCLDGLLLTGGADLHPTHYGEGENGSEMESVEPRRDSTEFWLTRWAIADDLPVLGICRGHQVLNVALGGSLYQDIPSQLTDSEVDHRGSTYTDDRSLLTHEVELAPGCKLGAIFGSANIQVNSLHHQGVKTVGQGLMVVGTSPDGVAEALESYQNRWVASVQWHPEELWRSQEKTADLFRAFIEAARVSTRQLV